MMEPHCNLIHQRRKLVTLPTWIHTHGTNNLKYSITVFTELYFNCLKYSANSSGSPEPASGASSRGSSIQPAPKRKRSSRGDGEDDVLIKYLSRLEERRAEREERRADMQMGTSLDEDEVFGQQIVTIMKCLDPAKNQPHAFKFYNFWMRLNFQCTHNFLIPISIIF